MDIFTKIVPSFEVSTAAKKRDGQRSGLSAVLIFRDPSAWNKSRTKLLMMKITTKAG